MTLLNGILPLLIKVTCILDIRRSCHPRPFFKLNIIFRIYYYPTSALRIFFIHQQMGGARACRRVCA